jgi:hypothetical protein
MKTVHGNKYTIGGEIQLGPGGLCLQNAYVDTQRL